MTTVLKHSAFEHKKNHRYLFVDTETTGISPQQGEKLIEIACVEVINRQITGKNFHTYLNPEHPVSDGAFRVHGLSNHFLKDKPLFATQAQSLLDYLKDATLIIHNAPFDLGFLNHELKALNLQTIEMYALDIIDSLKVARQLYAGKKNSLDALCDRLEINRQNRNYHGALLDSELLANVWLAMSRGQETLFNDASKQHSIENISTTDNTNYIALNLNIEGIKFY